MKKVMYLLGIFLFAAITQSFCGFYVAKANTKLYNKQSEVILVRQGNKTTVTMSNDFQGDVKDFAIVVPVPVVLQEKDVKVVRKDIFTKLNDYSEPRLVEYYDENPCQPQVMYDLMEAKMSNAGAPMLKKEDNRKAKKLGVTIEAQYTVGEYDILVLSAKESTGLKTWLTTNGYKIPEQAEEVLDPYIKNNLKFFVVKVNVEEMQKLGRKELSPIQITYESSRFMLPIRLGMANSTGTQDLVVYAFTENGRVECTNYRTSKIPTDMEIPEFIKSNFGQFYSDLFKNQYRKKGKNAVFLEYAWDLGSNNYVHCDPCSTIPPTFEELSQAGVFFVNYNNPSYSQTSDYTGKLFFTRLHVRYDRENFPMDLEFQETPNMESFQARYVMNHALTENLDCDMAKNYYSMVLDRREKELENLANLTGWDVSTYNSYLNQFRTILNLPKLAQMPKKAPQIFTAEVNSYLIFGLLFSLFVFIFLKYKNSLKKGKID